MALLVSLFACASLLQGADPLRPLRIVQVEYAAESQVDENLQLQEPSWVIRHRHGLKTVGVKSGATIDVLTRPPTHRLWEHSPMTSRLLTGDATVFAYQPLDAGGEPLLELIVARTSDRKMIVKLDFEKLTGERWAPFTHTYLADDASCLWTLAPGTAGKGSRILRIDLTAEPRIGAAVELKGARKDAFNLFVSVDEPALVVATTMSPGGGWFRVFDRDLKLREERRSPPSAAYFVAIRPKPLIFVSFPATSAWQLLGQHGEDFKVVSQATVGPPRPRWHLGETLLHAAALSPDGTLLVTSQVSQRPTMSVWNPANGKRIREVEVQDGGGYKLGIASHHTIFRLAFSKSGNYLTAADGANVYLIDTADLVKSSVTKDQ